MGATDRFGLAVLVEHPATALKPVDALRLAANHSVDEQATRAVLRYCNCDIASPVFFSRLQQGIFRVVIEKRQQ